jgi:hypothetical protein
VNVQLVVTVCMRSQPLNGSNGVNADRMHAVTTNQTDPTAAYGRCSCNSKQR